MSFLPRPLVLALLWLIGPAAALAQSFAPVTPEAAGFSDRRLARLDSAIQSTIDRGQMAGAIAVLLRDGKAVRFKPYGMKDIAHAEPMTTDAIFRIASMSKAVTTVAVMMLYEEGRFLLNDPVSKYIPEFADAVVAAPPPAGSPDSVRYVTERPHRPVTIRHLLTHTAGLTYGDGPAAEAWRKAGFSGWYFAGRNETIGEAMRRLARLPLQGQPGEVYQYGYSTDMLGYLVEVVSGMPLDAFFRTRIFEPLKMRDTHFYLPPEKLNRFTEVYGLDEQGKMTLRESAETSDYVKGPRRAFSGGAGLLSTATDYARLLQMLLNGGELDGVRLLSPKTVALMSADHVGPLYDGRRGFGLGFWVMEDVGRYGELGTEGAYGWGSAYYPIYWVDPKERLVGIFLTQLMPRGTLDLNERFFTLTYQALVR